MGEKIEWNHLLILALTQTVLLVEVAVIAFAISAFSRKNNMGIGIGLALLLFAADIMCRIVPAIENAKYITPFYYCNATDIYTGVEMSVWYYIIAVAVIGISFAAALGRYKTKDITA